MKQFGKIGTAVLLVVGLAVIVAVFLPQQEIVYDFIILYAANLGIINRVPIYDNQAITNLITGTTPATGDFTLFPYPYPPWYALSTFYLGFLSVDKAANAWMLLNIAMLVSSVLLLTDGCTPIYRLVTTLAGLIFIPALGLITVGQYSAPALLGAALFMYAARREDASLTALGLLLMTFKPHLGFLLLPAGLLWLVFQKTDFGRRALWTTIGGGLLLAGLSFVADPAWPLTYLRSLMSYTTLPGVASRDLSASLPVLLVKGFLGESSTFWTAWLSLVIATIMGLLFWRFRVLKNIETLVVGCTLITLLADPYLFNYDYVLLLLPLIYLAGQAMSLTNRLVLAAVYFHPWVSLIVELERSANILYALSAIVLSLMILRTPFLNIDDEVKTH
jgi:hypothetical protein